MNDRTLAPAWLSRSAFDTLVPGILLLHLTLSPLIFHRASLEVFEYSKVALLLTTALLLTGCILTAGWGRLSAVLGEITRSPLAAGFLLFALSAACSTATSIQPRTSLWGTFESFAGLWTMLAYTVLFLATWLATRTPEAARRLLAGSVAAAAFAAAYAVVQAVGWDPLPWALVSQVGDYDRPFATLGHANFLGAYLVMVVPVVAHFALLAWSRRHWLSLAVLLLVQALCVCAILLAMSRGAWLALICVCGVLAAGWASSSRQRWLGLCCVGLLICAGGLGGLGLMGKSEAGLLSHVQARLQQFAVAGSRGPVWRASLAMFRERPWFGCGLDAFPLAFGKHRPVELWNAEPNLTPVKAHSEFLHVLATQGLLGGLAVIVVLIGLAHAGWRAWRGTDAVDRPLVLAIIAGVVGFFVQVGFSFMVAGCGVLFVTFSAVLAGLASLRGTAMEQGPRPHALSMLVAGALALLAFGYNLEPLPWTGKPLAYAGCTVVVLSFVGTLYVMLRLSMPTGAAESNRTTPTRIAHAPRNGGARLAWQLAVWLGIGGAFFHVVWQPFRADAACAEGEAWLSVDQTEALRHYRAAVERDPSRDMLWLKLGTALLNIAESAPPEQRRTQYRLACEAFRRAQELSPAQAPARLGCAQALTELARLGEVSRDCVFAELEAGLALDPVFPPYLAQAGECALNLNALARADEYLRRGRQRYPGHVWLCVHSARLAVQQGRYSDAVQLIESIDGLRFRASEGDSGLWGAMSSLSSGYLFAQTPQIAVKLAREVVKNRPHWPAPRMVLGVGLLRMGQSHEARAEFEYILVLDPTHTGARRALASTDMGGEPAKR